MCVGAHGDRHLSYVGTRALVPRRTSSRHDQNVKQRVDHVEQRLGWQWFQRAVSPHVRLRQGRAKAANNVGCGPPQDQSHPCKPLVPSEFQLDPRTLAGRLATICIWQLGVSPRERPSGSSYRELLAAIRSRRARAAWRHESHMPSCPATTGQPAVRGLSTNPTLVRTPQGPRTLTLSCCARQTSDVRRNGRVHDPLRPSRQNRDFRRFSAFSELPPNPL